MSTLATGTQVEIDLAAGDSITIGGNCEVTTQYAGRSRIQKNPTAIGPLQSDSKVLIVAAASVTYTITVSTGSGNQFTPEVAEALEALVAGGGISADSGNALSAGSDNKPYYDGSGADGAVAWVSGRLYTANTDRVIAPGGGIVTCKTTHTSASFYDARQWIAYSDDGASVFDFTQLPDGLMNTVRPSRGSLSDFGIADSLWSVFRVKDGALQWNSDQATRNVCYLQLELNSKQRPVQHAWAYVECSGSPESNEGFLILIPGPYKWNSGLDANRAGIHWQLLANSGGTPTASMQTGPYNTTGVATGPTWAGASVFGGRRFRWDITINAATGVMRGYIDGVLVVQYTQSAVTGYISPYGLIEFNGPTWKVREFGISPNLPPWDGGNRYPTLGGGTFFANQSLTTSWQLIYQFKATYTESGAIEVMWSPFVNCPTGRIEMDLSDSVTAPAMAYPYRMCDAGTNARVPFRTTRTGTPGTTETIGVWARNPTNTGSSLRANDYGDSGGPRWSPVNLSNLLA